MEIRQAAFLHPDPEGQARRSARRGRNASRGAGPAARFRRRVLLQGVRRTAAAAAGAGTARRLRVADRRNRQVGCRVRIALARNPQRFPGHHSRTWHHYRGRRTDRDPDFEQRTRSRRRAEAPLPPFAHRLPRAEARGAHRRKPRPRHFADAAQADGRIHPRNSYAGPEEAAVGERNHRLGARAGSAAGDRTWPRDGQGYAQCAAEIRGGYRGRTASDQHVHRQGLASGRLRVARMRENLHRFFRAARGAGVRLSPAESIDAMRAVAKVGISDRTILRDTFLLTLAKTQDEKKALGDCFDLFFDQPEPSQAAPESGEADATEPPESGADSDASDGGDQTPDLGPLAQMLLSQDRNEIAAAIANASSAASLSDIRYFTQRGIFSGRMLDAMGIARLRDDFDGLTATNPVVAERLAAAP